MTPTPELNNIKFPLKVYIIEGDMISPNKEFALVDSSEGGLFICHNIRNEATANMLCTALNSYYGQQQELTTQLVSDEIQKAIKDVDARNCTSYNHFRNELEKAVAIHFYNLGSQHSRGQQWIEVGKELPEIGERVLSFSTDFGVQTSWLNQHSMWTYAKGVMHGYQETFTHWMPLPSAPVSPNKK